MYGFLVRPLTANLSTYTPLKLLPINLINVPLCYAEEELLMDSTVGPCFSFLMLPEEALFSNNSNL